MTGLSLQDVATGEVREIALPAEADISDISWSNDGSQIVFTNTRSDAMDLHVLSTATGEVATLMTGGVNPVFQNPSWMPDGSLMVLTFPKIAATSRPARSPRAGPRSKTQAAARKRRRAPIRTC